MNFDWIWSRNMFLNFKMSDACDCSVLHIRHLTKYQSHPHDQNLFHARLVRLVFDKKKPLLGLPLIYLLSIRILTVRMFLARLSLSLSLDVFLAFVQSKSLNIVLKWQWQRTTRKKVKNRQKFKNESEIRRKRKLKICRIDKFLISLRFIFSSISIYAKIALPPEAKWKHFLSLFFAFSFLSSFENIFNRRISSRRIRSNDHF